MSYYIFGKDLKGHECGSRKYCIIRMLRFSFLTGLMGLWMQVGCKQNKYDKYVSHKMFY